MIRMLIMYTVVCNEWSRKQLCNYLQNLILRVHLISIIYHSCRSFYHNVDICLLYIFEQLVVAYLFSTSSGILLLLSFKNILKFMVIIKEFSKVVFYEYMKEVDMNRSQSNTLKNEVGRVISDWSHGPINIQHK